MHFSAMKALRVNWTILTIWVVWCSGQFSPISCHLSALDMMRCALHAHHHTFTGWYYYDNWNCVKGDNIARYVLLYHFITTNHCVVIEIGHTNCGYKADKLFQEKNMLHATCRSFISIVMENSVILLIIYLHCIRDDAMGFHFCIKKPYSHVSNSMRSFHRVPVDALRTLYIQTQFLSSIETSPNRNCGREPIYQKSRPFAFARLPAAPHTKRRVKHMWAGCARFMYRRGHRPDALSGPLLRHNLTPINSALLQNNMDNSPKSFRDFYVALSKLGRQSPSFHFFIGKLILQSRRNTSRIMPRLIIFFSPLISLLDGDAADYLFTWKCKSSTVLDRVGVQNLSCHDHRGYFIYRVFVYFDLHSTLTSM